MKLSIFIFSFILFVSCSKQSASNPPTNIQNNLAGQNEKIKESEIPKKLSIPKTQIPLPNVKSYGVYGVSRNSDNVDGNSHHLPPYKKVEIYNAYWKNKPSVGEKVTIIPLDTEFAPFDISIKGVTNAKGEYTETCGNDDKEIFWKIEFEKLAQKEFFEMKPIDGKRAEEFPFDVFVIYPTVKFARQLKQTELTKQTIPNDSSVNEVSAAVDLTNDGTPDLIEIRYCCSGRNMSPDDPNCDYSDCGELWKKVGNSWKKIHSWSPC